jgi:hypothetical protein
LTAGNGDLGPDVDGDTVRSTREFGIVEEEEQHLAEGERHHDEIDAAGTQHQRANQQGRRAGAQDRNRKRR